MAGTRKGRLTAPELLALLGGTARTQLTAWEKKGLPYTTAKSRRGSPRHLYDRDAALRWVAANGTGRYPLEAAKLLKAEERGKRTEEPERDTPPEAAGEESGGTLSDQLTNALLKSAASFDRWDKLERESFAAGDYRVAAIAAKQRVEAGKAVATLQEAVTAQAKEMGILVVASEMEGRYLKILNTVKNRVTVIPESAIPGIMPFLREPNDAAKVRDFLTGRVEDALRYIANAEVD